MADKRIAVIRVRGHIRIRKRIEDTLKMLRLYRKNTCVVLSNSPTITGMVNKAKDYVTWGEIDKETFKLLLEKRGRLPANKPLTDIYFKEQTKSDINNFVEEYFAFKKELKDVPGLKLFFRLKPPTKGFERKGTKKPFSLGGALGYRKEKINDIIKRMI